MLQSIVSHALVALLISTAALAETAAIVRPDGSSVSVTQIDSNVTQLIQAAHVTGVGLAIFHEGKVAYLHAYGLRDLEKNLPLTPDSVMTSASLSKAAFAVLVMRLAQAHILDLDKSIAEYLPKPLPEYPQYADLKNDERWRKLTLRILLSHTSGFPNLRAFEDDRKLRIYFEPGTRYAYSGEGIQLAQLVVETVTGKSLSLLMDENIFRPQQMTRTSMVWESRFENDFANGYDEYGRSLGPEKRPKPDAGGSMQTTLRDYATLVSALMSGKVLNRRTAGIMFSPQITIHSAHQFPSLALETSASDDAIRLRYGLGWGMYSSPYGKAFFKEGHDEGWRHLVLCFRQHGDGILILTNSSNGEGIFKPLIEVTLGSTGFPFDWENYTPYTLLQPLRKLKERKQVTLTSEELSRVTGRYALSSDVVMAVTVEGGHLFIQENEEPKQEYLAESPNDFFSSVSTDECSFKPAEGPTQVLVLRLDDGRSAELKRLP